MAFFGDDDLRVRIAALESRGWIQHGREWLHPALSAIDGSPLAHCSVDEAEGQAITEATEMQVMRLRVWVLEQRLGALASMVQHKPPPLRLSK